MNEVKKSQTIFITGESGSGKTESTKNIVEFLCKNTNSSVGIKNWIVASMPVLEEFGNALTQNNDNSSRFCKFIEVRI